MNYAYLDIYGVMHVTNDETTAKRESKTGKYIETDIAKKGGYPEIGGKIIVVYGLDECYTDTNRADPEKKLDTENAYPVLAKLYNELL